MSQEPGETESILGLRVKSGWAAGVLLRGPSASPAVLGIARLELSDPTIPESVQPYHAGYGTPRTDRQRIAQLIRVIRRCAKQNLGRWLEQCHTSGAEPGRAAVVGTSTTDPSRITNPHIRIHAREGRLFREVIEHALVAAGLQPTFLLEQHLLADTATLLGLTPETLRHRLKDLARRELGPWRAEQKSAALGAWLLLSRPPSKHRGAAWFQA